jgi:hypothetical protein
MEYSIKADLWYFLLQTAAITLRKHLPRPAHGDVVIANRLTHRSLQPLRVRVARRQMQLGNHFWRKFGKSSPIVHAFAGRVGEVVGPVGVLRQGLLGNDQRG